MTLCFDTCALNRLYDFPPTERIVSEQAAVIRLLDAVNDGRAHWVASTVLEFEILRNPNEVVRDLLLELLIGATTTREETAADAIHAVMPRSLGIRGLDALHLAMAGAAGADYLVSTDSQFVSAAARARSVIHESKSSIQ